MICSTWRCGSITQLIFDLWTWLRGSLWPLFWPTVAVAFVLLLLSIDQWRNMNCDDTNCLSFCVDVLFLLSVSAEFIRSLILDSAPLETESTIIISTILFITCYFVTIKVPIMITFIILNWNHFDFYSIFSIFFSIFFFIFFLI